MQELSMHILDIAENSINAGADEIIIRIREGNAPDRFDIEIEDNGKGMSPTFLSNALDPFTTTKKGKRVGLGLSLLREAARATGGDMKVDSKLGKGTVVRARFGLSHIDRQPLGDLTETLVMLIIGSPDVAFQVVYAKDGLETKWDTGEIEERFGDVFRSHPDVLDYIRDALRFVKSI